ncbi:GntR family transcriptional regulator, trehalose operon transcriptional repressor [Mesobacillus persicus]|uniref:Trehalose operon repressor n=1 Tax=Mesobacillus persicus TaxID=930146 RepID=A0A1H8IU71_9BACI|nr:trehalose operon repressor [Mesobacillus persicus]SEN71899.1 GntR family transcriptional regulator, trehalose operon transcriptional repressor [Mesobacillus persicus]
MKNKFIKIKEELADQIRNGKMEVGALLPSENELAERYSASRETIRKALNMLSEEGFIHKVQGKGSIVLDVSKFDFPISGLVSFKELAKKMGHRAKTIVEEFEQIRPTTEMKKTMRLEKDDAMWKIYRVREIDGEKIILDKDYLVEKFAPDLTKEICQNSIYEYLEGELGLTISFAKKEITMEMPTEEDCRYLDLDGFQYIVVVKNFVYLDDASMFQYTESRHRPDKFRFVDFARRK